MVRETRHLWVGNLPDNIREDRIREHFKRYGRVQNVKLLGRTESAGAGASVGAVSGVCATVAFMDIKSASKAHNTEHVLDERTLTTEYYEPAAIPPAGAPSAGSSPAGSGYSGSSSSVSSAPAPALAPAPQSAPAPAPAPAPASVSRYHLSGGEEGTGTTCAIAATAAAPANWRGTNDSATDYPRRGNTPAAYGRYQRSGGGTPYATPPPNADRTTPQNRYYGSAGGAGTGGESTPSTPGGGTESGRARRRSGSGSSRSDSSSAEPSDASRASTPAGAAPPAARTPTHHQWASTASGRPLAICVRNLPTRSTDSSLKDGLYHEYKKHGKVVWVKVVGQNADRYAVVRFKKPSDVEKALEVSQDKLFFGCKISVGPHQSCDEDADSAKPYETDIDEYHPKATRTLFIGNLEKDVTQQQLRDKFKHFGRIIEIDIKKGSGGGAGYAFCQYASISSVVDAIRAMDGEHVGGSRVKLGFGKPVATTCVWIDGLNVDLGDKQQVMGSVVRYCHNVNAIIDRTAGTALMHFEQAAMAGAAVRELRRLAALASASDPERPRLSVDYASRECQEAFYEQLEKHGGPAAIMACERLTGEIVPRYIPSSTRHEPLRHEGGTPRARSSSYGRGSSRASRYSAVEHYDSADYAADRRYRVYDELGSSPQTEEAPLEDKLQSVVVSPHRARRHRRDSSTEERKHSKERHRGVSVTGVRRSRSGSRGGVSVERHPGRRRHRRRCEGSGSRSHSRAGTPLRDEPDAPPSEPRRPPTARERPLVPMSLPLPKFAAQLLRAAAPAPRATPAPAPAPDSPPRPPSTSSSSAGSAPHSPSLEERIRSLDEKYEKWSGSRALPAAPEPPDRVRLRHRLLEVDINEVKPSEVVRSLLAKRSVFDEDSERLEGAVRAPSPGGSPRARVVPFVPRALRYPFPAHHAHPASRTPPTPPTPHTPLTPQPLPILLSTLPLTSQPPLPIDIDADSTDRPADPRLNRPERTYQIERLGKFNESDYKLDTRTRLRTPSTDKSLDLNERRRSPRSERERLDLDRDPRRDIDKRRRNSLYSASHSESKSSFEAEEKEVKEAIERIDPDFQNRERNCVVTIDKCKIEENLDSGDDKLLPQATLTKNVEKLENHTISPTESSGEEGKDNTESDVTDSLLGQIDKRQEPFQLEQKLENESKISEEKSLKSDDVKHDLLKQIDSETSQSLNENKLKSESDDCKEILIQNHINKEILDLELHLGLNTINSLKQNKEISELTQELIKNHDKNGKERYNQHIILEAFHNTRLEKENIEFDKSSDKEKCVVEKRLTDSDKSADRSKNDRDKVRLCKERAEKDRHDTERDKSKNNRNERVPDKNEKEKKSKDDSSYEKSHPDKVEKYKPEKEIEKVHKNDKEIEKSKHHEEKSSRHDHYKKDKRKDNGEIDSSKIKKEDKYKHDRRKESSDSKREYKKDLDGVKIRKSSRDESSRDLCRKDSTDSSTSRASHDSTKLKDLEIKEEIKEELKPKLKYYNELFLKKELDKEFTKSVDTVKVDQAVKIKEEKEQLHQGMKSRLDNLEPSMKSKTETSEKQRHYSLDSPSVDCKRKERLNSSSSLPSHIGHKRRMSSQDSIDFLNEELKKSKNELKRPERRDSKDSRSADRHKTTKFNKGHFAKLIESKTKDDKKNQVKPPDDTFTELRDLDIKDQKKSKKSPKRDNDEKVNTNSGEQPEGLRNDLDFLATLELRSSEEDERQKALRKEMKEKKRIQQLQQIQELQMQQDAMQHAELMGKFKDEKKQRSDDKKKEAAREKRMSTDRKSRDDKNDTSKRKNRKHLQSTDTSDSDEPKKHSIFDIVDDGPTYISMYDKVKARSCKNMQKQEEEKRQEKIKAKFSQLKQSRAKREEKKRSSWDEDSDSDQDRTKPQKVDSSSDDEQIVIHSKRREKSHGSLDFDRSKTNDYFSIPSTEEDSRNKLSRKNSRTRIISDTSDDDTSKRSFSKSPSFNDIRKEFMSSFGSLHKIKDQDFKESDKIKKSSLLNLFGKSDSDDSKLKSSFESNDNKHSFMKSLSNDFSSESESMISNRNTCEVRKKHKKKQKKHRFSFSGDESKLDINDALILDCDTKHKNQEKIRRHSNKKDKRKDKIRDSIDADDDKGKSRKDKRPQNSFDSNVEISCNSAKKEGGKMEDIFGPLSDESDRELGSQNNKPDAPIHDYDSTFSISSDQLNVTMNSEEVKLKEKEDKNRKRDKKRKEKRPFVKEDDNSLDVDAVSKAIEARLFADTVTDDDNRAKVESLYTKKIQGSDIKVEDKNMHIGTNKITDKHSERIKRDSKEKKKKKKKNREDRQNRKDHHHFNHNEKNDKIEHISDQDALELSSKSMLLDIPLPNDTQIITANKLDSSNLVSESPSLPRLTDSPPIALRPCINTDTKNKDSDTPGRHSGDHNMEIDYLEKKGIEVIDIPMPLEMPPKTFENVVPDISEVPLPKDPIPIKSDQDKSELFVPSFERDIAVSEDAVRSIPNIEKEVEKAIDKVDTQSSKVDKKLDEKPRAIISQEETEDAVAALLGESFGGKVDSFANCYEEVENNSTHQIEIECVTIESGNIPEEDAEEMRQAVQNLNACEMEMKPDTPVSDNDLLLIDTDTEEADETPQDAIDRLPVNIIATNQNLNVNTEQTKIELSSIITAKPKPPLQTVQIVNSESKEPNINLSESDGKLQLPKRDIVQQITSTATPVITSWTLTNKKLLEPRILNIQPNKSANLEVNANDKKPTHITANIVQIKGAQTQGMNSSLRPIITSNRVSAPYQVINHMIRPQIPNMQPPTIKIPEPHILYQKSQGVVISPRMSNDPRLQSPKASGQAEGMTSPRLANINLALANTNNISPQNLNSVGVRSPNTLQQRSPGQVTVVRVQQPPLSPIQAMNLPHGGRTMVSPNRPNSVLVQTQGAPIHYNRLPVTPVLAPISKQMNVNNMMQQNKVIGVNSTLMHQQKIITGDYRKNDHRNMTDNLNENSKIIMSPTSLQHSTNPTVMAQNRLISMQNAIHAGNVNSLHLTNKVLVNNINNLNDKREHQIQKSEQHNHIPFGSKPIIHVAGVNHSSASIIQNSTKPIMCTLQEANSLSRGQGSNVIHTINSQRLLTTAPLSNIRHIDANKGPLSVLSMATIRSPTVLTRLESSNTVAVTTNSLTNVVMTPLLLKTSSSSGTIRLSNNKNDVEHSESHLPKNTLNHLPLSQDKVDVKIDPIKTSPIVFDASDKHKYVKPEPSPVEPVNKSETDFEELLKDNTNEIKVTNDPDKKLEVNVGKTVTLFTTNSQYRERNQSTENCAKVEIDKEIEKSTRDPTVQPAPLPDGKDVVQTNLETNKLEVVMDSTVASSLILKPEPVEAVKENDPATIKDPLEDTNIDKICANEDQKLPVVNSNKHESIFPVTISNHLQIDDNQMKHLDENDSWTAKDVNIESVIKKVDSLCNEIVELDNKDDKSVKSIAETTSEQTFNAETNFLVDELDSSKPMEIQTENESFTDLSLAEQSSAEKTVSASKRGGRNVRGKKSEKNQDRVQTRQIVKPLRGGVSAKRGRGRARVDKKIKILVNQSPNNIPGDVYDFHEDSGDETSASPNKSEPRPRLILTIKSPLSGQCNAIATSTLSITPKDPLKNPEKTNKEDKPEDFASPSLNTRKSRRLQEKDVQRNTVDDVIEDVVKGANTQAKSGKDVNKKRPTRQIGPKTTQTDKGSGSDTRKSPRGVKRMRDRSLSDASVDSSDEKIAIRDDTPKEAKILKIEEPSIASKLERDPLQPAKTIQLVSANIPSVTPTPITKPPKKMISEISAKLASAFEAAAAAGPVRAAPHPAERAPAEPDKPPPCEPRDPELATAAPAAAEPTPVATAEARVSVSAVCTAEAHGGGEAALARRSDAVGVGGGMAPVGATEASDARVQSPALPHRPPAPHRLADRVTPLLVRGGDGEGASVAGVASVASVAAGAAAAGARAPRGYAGTASLPRGAHHPPHPPHAAHPAHPALPAHPAHPHAKHVAVIGPHNPHTHTGAASRVTITSVPTISPQGQIALGEGMYPHFSHQHYQMYQHHFRATQHESRATPSPYTRSLEAEGCEAPTPPLELRRPPSARMPRPAHSPSPADRLIMYAAGGGRSPPPAHVTSRLPGALPPAAVHGPPHASQVPREADSLQMLLRRYPVMWQGLLALKNDSAAVQMHFVGGNPGVAGDTLPRHTDGSTPPLRIAQRMRLEPAQLDQVHRKMKLENEHCILLALPCGRDHMDVLQQSTNLTAGFITYLQRKQAAGIVNVAPPGHHQAMFTVHIFPSCDFANENLNRIAPDLMHRVADIAHLLIVIATATV